MHDDAATLPGVVSPYACNIRVLTGVVGLSGVGCTRKQLLKGLTNRQAVGVS